MSIIMIDPACTARIALDESGRRLDLFSIAACRYIPQIPPSRHFRALLAGIQGLCFGYGKSKARAKGTGFPPEACGNDEQ
jgi:hypothetical protein